MHPDRAINTFQLDVGVPVSQGPLEGAAHRPVLGGSQSALTVDCAVEGLARNLSAGIGREVQLKFAVNCLERNGFYTFKFLEDSFDISVDALQLGVGG